MDLKEVVPSTYHSITITINSIDVVCGIGDIYTHCKHLAATAKLFGHRVKSKFNDMPIYADPDDTADTIADRWTRDRRQRQIDNAKSIDDLPEDLQDIYRRLTRINLT